MNAIQGLYNDIQQALRIFQVTVNLYGFEFTIEEMFVFFGLSFIVVLTLYGLLK